MRRRDFLKATAAGLVASPGLLAACGDRPEGRSHLQVAEEVAAWLRGNAREARRGLTWPVVPAEGPRAAIDLYSGTPGILLFLLELHHATGDPELAREIMDGAFLLQGAYLEFGGWPAAAGTTPEDPAIYNPGLYTGWTGAAFTLAEVFEGTGDESARLGALTLYDLVIGAARPVEGGALWFDQDPADASYDIISGSAGIGLGLLHAYKTFGLDLALDVAYGAGLYLEAKGRAAEGGLKWPLSESNPRLMPNFSHGTAGVSYFLARLAEETQEEKFLDAAVLGARYLQAVSSCRNDGCLVFHHEPGGEDLFYLGWCHGPVGTVRLYHQLARMTGDREWTDWVLRGARGIRDQGIPETRTAGFWNNVSQCCGDAGVGDFFLSLAAETGDEEQVRFARDLADFILREADEDGGGLHWTQAEHRTRPELLQAQTGWMQGAAGIGAFFLHLDGVEKGRKPRIVLPDSPWSA